MAQTPTADFVNPDWQFPLAQMQAVVNKTVSPPALHAFRRRPDLALRLLGGI
ncbi:MAG: hypothetical protein IPI44_24010 [Sulfuritalea sp.]|nr:hypothetical protein [Sulfuritalea sp.]